MASLHIEKQRPQRTLAKGAVEMGVAVATAALVFLVDEGASLGLDPEVYGIVSLVAQVVLQGLRRVGRDARA